MVLDEDVNDRIKKIRDQHLLKQSDISEITGYSVNTIKKWMMGKDQRHYTKAPVQALKLLESWVNNPQVYNENILKSELKCQKEIGFGQVNVECSLLVIYRNNHTLHLFNSAIWMLPTDSVYGEWPRM